MLITIALLHVSCSCCIHNRPATQAQSHFAVATFTIAHSPCSCILLLLLSLLLLLFATAIIISLLLFSYCYLLLLFADTACTLLFNIVIRCIQHSLSLFARLICSQLGAEFGIAMGVHSAWYFHTTTLHCSHYNWHIIDIAIFRLNAKHSQPGIPPVPPLPSRSICTINTSLMLLHLPKDATPLNGINEL